MNDTKAQAEHTTGTMTKAQHDYFVRQFASEAQETMRRKSWGPGEADYYIRENCDGLVESELATRSEATGIRQDAYELLCQADENGMTIDEPSYNSKFENERITA